MLHQPAATRQMESKVQQTRRADSRPLIVPDSLMEGPRYPFLLALILALMVGVARVLS